MMGAALRLGDWVTLDGRKVEVVSIRGQTVTLVDEGGQSEIWGAGALIAAAEGLPFGQRKTCEPKSIRESGDPVFDRPREAQIALEGRTM